MKHYVLPKRGSLQTCTITYQAPFEETIAAVDLPNAEPVASQYIWTVAAGDLPTFSMTPKSVKYIGCFYAGGRNTTAGASKVYWRMVKNGGSVATGNTSVTTAASYWTLSAFFYDITVGDVLELRLWADAAAGHNRSYQANFVFPTRLSLSNYKEVLKNLSFALAGTGYPTLTGGAGIGVNPVLHFGEITGATSFLSFAYLVGVTLFSYCENSIYKILRANYGDSANSNTGTVRIHASNLPYYYRHEYAPTAISFRNLGEVE
jgi:hypothetical protein